MNETPVSELLSSSKGFMAPGNLNDLLMTIINWIVELFSVDAAEISLWDDEKKVLILSVSNGFMEKYTGYTLLPGEGLAGKVYQLGEPIIVPDYHAMEGKIDEFEVIQPNLTCLVVPMKWQSRTIGVLTLDADPTIRTFSEDDIHRALLFANVAAIAIHNARLNADLQKKTSNLQTTLEKQVALRTGELARHALQLETSVFISKEITSILDIDRLLSRVVDVIAEAFGFAYVLVFIVDEKHEKLLLKAANGAPGKQLIKKGFFLTIESTSMNGYVAKNNQPISVNNVSTIPFFMENELMPDTRSELVVPLSIGNRMFGTLDVQSKQLDAFLPDDLLIFQSLGAQIAIAIENANLYQRNRELAIIEERNRLARELHDSVTQMLFSINLNSETAKILLDRDSQRVAGRLERIQHLAYSALTEMRSLIHQLRPLSSEWPGLIPSLDRLISECEINNGVRVFLSVKGFDSLDFDTELAIYRIIQEALNNVIKHAKTLNAWVSINYLETNKGTILRLSIKDKGVGFLPASSKNITQLGLKSMQERVGKLGGKFKIVSQPGKGTSVLVRIPIEKELKK